MLMKTKLKHLKMLLNTRGKVENNLTLMFINVQAYQNYSTRIMWEVQLN
jgi:hypothetical protein